MITLSNTERHLTSLGIYAHERRCVYSGWSCIAYPDGMLSLLELPFSAAYWPCLMPPHTGEVHSGGSGKPGAVPKIFCPGTEAEQPKHEGIVWSVYGEYCFA